MHFGHIEIKNRNWKNIMKVKKDSKLSLIDHLDNYYNCYLEYHHSRI